MHGTTNVKFFVSVFLTFITTPGILEAPFQPYFIKEDKKTQ